MYRERTPSTVDDDGVKWRFNANQADLNPLIQREHCLSSSAIPTYKMQLIPIEEIVIMIPAGVLYQPTEIMMEDGHRITRTSVLPSTMISQMPYSHRRPRTVPHTE